MCMHTQYFINIIITATHRERERIDHLIRLTHVSVAANPIMSATPNAPVSAVMPSAVMGGGATNIGAGTTVAHAHPPQAAASPPGVTALPVPMHARPAPEFYSMTGQQQQQQIQQQKSQLHPTHAPTTHAHPTAPQPG